jgi:translation initiation factor 2B subunit (eIF-2B alpha/beta/delta family)
VHFINELLAFHGNDVRRFSNEYRSYWKKVTANTIAKSISDLSHTTNYLLHSHSETVVNYFQSIKSSKKEIEIWQTASLPAREGEIQARRLSELGFSINMVADQPHQRIFEKIEVFLSGADAVSKVSFINKAGTRFLARKAAGQGKPVIVLADPRKFVSDEVQFRMIKNSMGELFEETPVSLVSKVIAGL